MEARIIMNSRDAMMHAVVDKLDESNAVENLKKLRECLYKQCGGKTSLSLPESIDFQLAINAGFSKSPSYDKCKIITRDKMNESLEAMQQKRQVQANLQNIESGVWQFVSNTELLKDPRALYKFKKAHADFVNESKRKAGIYSAIAEEKKLKNPHVMHFAIKKGNAILATFMATVAGDQLYLADLIVHKDRWNEKLAQTLLTRSYQEIFKAQPNIRSGWLIAGGHGLEPDGKHLYDDVLLAQNIDANVQHEHSIIIKLTAPGPILLNAANRSLEEPHDTLDVKQQPSIKFGLSEQPITPQVHEENANTIAPGNINP